jgi:pyrroloquinoline quinone biosynthesis protein D
MQAADLLSRPALASQVRLRVDPITGERVLLYPEGILVLNETAHDIVTRCDGAATIAEIAAALADEYDAPSEQLAAEIAACLHDLHQRQLIVLAP